MNVKMLDLQAQYAPIRDEIRAAMDRVCDSQSLILGPAVESFEKKLAAYCQVKHAIGVSSGTDALLCALMALGIGPGDEVICPAFTFFASAGSIARTGATPVFCDIDPRTFNIDVADAARRITARTKAIMPVHLFGQLAAMENVNDLAAAHKLAVVEDAAQAIGATRINRPACAWGTIGCLSFYPTKNLGAFGDAGAICTNDDHLADLCRKLRVHGSGHTYYHEMIGGMFRMAALQAAVLEVKLNYLPVWHEGRRRIAAAYDKLLAGSSFTTPQIDAGNWSIYNQYVLRAPHRDAVKDRLSKAAIPTAIYYPLPLHLQTCFNYLGHKEGDFPAAEQACREVLALPMYPELPQDQPPKIAAELLAAAR